MQIFVDNLLVNYQLSGRGKLVLVLHGWGDNIKGLSSLSAALSKQYQVLAVDLPGFGATEVPKETWDLDNYAGFVAALLTKLDLGQLYAVVGHSNGGALAIRATSLGRLQPQKLVLLASAGIRNKPSLKLALLNVLAKAGNLATIWMPARYRDGLRHSLYKAAGSDILVVPALADTFRKTVRQDVQADAAQLAVPTLLIFGKNDQAVPLADGETYHRLIKSSHLEILGTGHFVHLDKPAEVQALIGDFLK